MGLLVIPSAVEESLTVRRAAWNNEKSLPPARGYGAAGDRLGMTDWAIENYVTSMTTGRANSGLLIVGHGSTVNPDSSAPSLAHAAEIRRRNLFANVACVFWKEEPSLRDAIFLFDDRAIREVYVVPNFISEGYFTETVIPRELELSGRVTTRARGQVWKYCEPVGNHALMTELLLERARDIAPAVSEKETSLLIVAHGTDLNDKSAVAAKREAEKIRALHRYRCVLNVYMEEAPLVSDWAKMTETPNVIVLPFFISDGLHSYEDIPQLLGITSAESTSRSGGFPAAEISENGGHGNRRSLMPQGVREIFQNNPYKIDGRSLFYAPSIGTDPRIADVILEQVEAFDRSDCVLPEAAPSSRAKM